MTDVFLAMQENILVLRRNALNVLWDKVKQCHQLSSTWFKKSGGREGKRKNKTDSAKLTNLAKPHTVLTVLFFKFFWKLKNIQNKKEKTI